MKCLGPHMNTPVVPKASPETLPELATYLAPFAPLFRRSTSRESVERYLTGLLTDLPRKNCDTIAAAVAGTSTERLQHLLSDAAWEPQALDQQRVTALIAQSPSQGILVLDDTGLPKQGRSSVVRDCRTVLVGVAPRQVAYVVGASSSFGVRLPDEVLAATLAPPPRLRGRGQPKKPRPAPLYAAQAVLEALPEDRWQTITW